MKDLKGWWSTAFAAVLSGLLAYGAFLHPATTLPVQKRPNIVMVYTDDQPRDMFAREYMPKTFSNVVEKGVNFTNYYNSTPLCCPTRATYQRGQYSHNTGVLSNVYPSGSYQKFRERGYTRRNVGVWMQRAGYATAYVGRVMNGYQYFLPEIPDGWDRWVSLTREMNAEAYQINDNGRVYMRERSLQDDTDHLADKAVAFVNNRAPSNQPFFLQVSAFPPHTPYFHAERYENTYEDKELPRGPGFNEEDVSDKPSHVQARERLDEMRIAGLEEIYEDKLRGVRTVDDLIGDIVVALKRRGEWGNTVVLVTTDNGFGIGNRRVVSKIDPYEESSRTFLAMAGPGIAKGVAVDELTSSNDVVPTIMGYARAPQKDFFDGRPLGPLADGDPPPYWRRAVGIEYLANPNEYAPTYETYYGLVTADGRKYVRYTRTGEEELYDLRADPYELQNLAGEPGREEELAELKSWADAIRACRAASCKAAEDK